MNVKIISEINKIKAASSSGFHCTGLDLIQIVSEHLIEYILFCHIVIAPEQMAITILKDTLKRRSNRTLPEM